MRELTPKIIIEVENGCIRSVYSSNENIQVEVIDIDNLRSEGLDSSERQEKWEKATEGMTEIF